MDGIKISVIIPVYNAEKYLRDCLNSVLVQTLKDIEIICIDDGSIDKSNEILHEYESKDKRIMIVKQKNKGAAIARNEGIKCSRGEYVIFLDSDDYYPNDKVLEKLYFVIKKYGVKAAGGEFGEIDIFGNVCQGKDYTDKKLYGYSFLEEGVIRYRDYQFDYGYTRFLFEREMIMTNELYFPPLSFFEDPPFLVRALSAAEIFAVIPQTMYMYRVDHKQREWTQKKSSDLFKGLVQNLKFAKDNAYSRLFELTLSRMENDYKCVIDYYVTSLEQIQQIIGDNEKVFDDRKQFTRLSNIVNPYKGRAENSVSYKVGLVLTYIPRKIVHLIGTIGER